MVLAAVLSENGLGLPRNAALGGEAIDALLGQTAVLTGLVALALLGVLLVSLVRRAPVALPERPRVTLAGALALFALIDGNLLLRGGRADAEPGEGPAVRVEVNAHQWAWDIRTPGADGRFGTPDDVVRLNELVVPVGRRVEVELAAVDVVHGFSIPNLRIKADAVPGQINRLQFAAATEGEYEIACAQHCGLDHYKMRGVLKVVSAAAYAAWLEQAAREAVATDDALDAEAHWAWPWDTP